MMRKTQTWWCVAIVIMAMVAVRGFCMSSAVAAPGLSIDRGLCVVICGKTADMPVKLGASGKVAVHCIVPDDKVGDKLKAAVAASGENGIVAVEKLPLNPLPYRDNMANMVMIEDFAAASAAGLKKDEALRVLAPGGSLCVRTGSKWEFTKKPWPVEMDEWTHPYHSADGNCVSSDKIVKFPVGMRWNDDLPFNIPIDIHNANSWTATRAMVLSDGRCFTMSTSVQENLRRTHEEMYRAKTGQTMYVTARDAWNGMLLWRKSVGDLFYGGLHVDNRSPLVAVSNRVFTVSESGKMIAFDAANGNLVRTYDTAFIPGRILCDQNVLVAATWKEGSHIGPLVGVDRRLMEYSVADGTVEGFDPASGKRLWQVKKLATSIRSADGILYIINRNGADVFEENKDRLPDLVKLGKEKPIRPEQRLVAIDLRSGKELWNLGPKEIGLNPEDHVFVDAAGLGVVTVSINNGGKTVGFSAKDGKQLFATNRGSYTAIMDGLIQVGGTKFDPQTGAEKGNNGVRIGSTVCTPVLYVNGIRVENRGCNYNDNGKPARYGAARGACMFASIPAFGAFYAAQNWCRCAPGQVAGIVSYGPVGTLPTPEEMQSEPVVEKGPAFGVKPMNNAANGWTMYRQGADRGCGTLASAPEKAGVKWTLKSTGTITNGPVAAGCRDSLVDTMTAPVASDGIVVVADIHRHQVVGINAASGKEVWRKTVGGRVDTAPTLYKGLCLFGSHDGMVYALRCQDGSLVWKMRVAPEERRMVSYGQVESVWPVIGSVLVIDNVAYASAGRSVGSDNGLVVRAFDPLTGKTAWTRVLGGEERINDILLKVGNSVQLMTARLDAKTGEKSVDPVLAFDRLPQEQKKDATPPKEIAPATDIEGFMCGNWRVLGNRRHGFNSFGNVRQTMVSWDDDLVCGTDNGRSVVAFKRSEVGGARENKGPSVAWHHGCPGRQVVAMVPCKNAVVIGGGVYPENSTVSKGFIRVLSKDKGAVLSDIEFDTPLCYDGLAVNDGKIFATFMDGTTVCLDDSGTAQKAVAAR